jgi:hypothetical protein
MSHGLHPTISSDYAVSRNDALRRTARERTQRATVRRTRRPAPGTRRAS